jgi:hypothetical protein
MVVNCSLLGLGKSTNCNWKQGTRKVCEPIRMCRLRVLYTSVVVYIERGQAVCQLRSPMGLLFIAQMIYEYGEPRWNDADRGKSKNLDKTCRRAILSTTNPIWTEPGVKPRLRGERQAINRLSHGTAILSSINLSMTLRSQSCNGMGKFIGWKRL